MENCSIQYDLKINVTSCVEPIRESQKGDPIVVSKIKGAENVQLSARCESRCLLQSAPQMYTLLMTYMPCSNIGL